MSVDEWLRRIWCINYRLPYINYDGIEMTNNELIKEVILPNILVDVQFDMNFFRDKDLINLVGMKMNAVSKWRNNSRGGRGNGQSNNCGNKSHDNKQRKGDSEEAPEGVQQFYRLQQWRVKHDEQKIKTWREGREDPEEQELHTTTLSLRCILS